MFRTRSFENSRAGGIALCNSGPVSGVSAATDSPCAFRCSYSLLKKGGFRESAGLGRKRPVDETSHFSNVCMGGLVDGVRRRRCRYSTSERKSDHLASLANYSLSFEFLNLPNFQRCPWIQGPLGFHLLFLFLFAFCFDPLGFHKLSFKEVQGCLCPRALFLKFPRIIC